jgi:hypothetical protein
MLGPKDFRGGIAYLSMYRSRDFVRVIVTSVGIRVLIPADPLTTCFLSWMCDIWTSSPFGF